MDPQQDSSEPLGKRMRTLHDMLTHSSGPQKRTRKMGALKQMSFLPLEMLTEIFGHLYPLDILHLAQSTREMRALLMSRNSALIWKQARSHIEDLPDCPSGMSEPQYANLLFSPQCHYCGANRVRKIIWSTKNRACPPCFKQHYARTKDLANEPKLSDLPENVWKLAQITGNIIHCTSYLPITSRDMRPQIVNLDQLDAIINEYMKIKGQPLQAEKWLMKMKCDYDTWAEVVERMEKWHDEDAEKRSQLNSIVRQRRFDAIVHNLNALGWKEEIEAMDLEILRRHKVVHRTEDLTDRAWHRIKPMLIELMEDTRSNRLEVIRLGLTSARRQLFSQYIDYCTSKCSVTAPVSELSTMDHFRPIIEDTPMNVYLTMSSFPSVQRTHDILRQWQYDKKQVLLSIMRNSALVPRNIDTKHIDLATTFFHCDGLAFPEPIGQQQILVHPGAVSRSRSRTYDSAYLARLFWDFGQEFWNFTGDRVSFHEPAFLAARSIVVACGLDPEKTYAQNLDQRVPLIECTSCSNINDGRLVMTWRRGVIHAIDHLSGDMKQLPQWAKMIQDGPGYKYAWDRLVAEPPSFRCHICQTSGSERIITAHVKERHSFLQTMRINPQPNVPVRVPYIPSWLLNYLQRAST